MAEQTSDRLPNGPIEAFERKSAYLYKAADAIEDPERARAAKGLIDNWLAPGRRLVEIDELLMVEDGPAIYVPSAEGVATYRGMFPDDFPEVHKEHIRRLMQRQIGAPEVGTPMPGDL